MAHSLNKVTRALKLIANGLSYQEVGRRLKVHPATISVWANARQPRTQDHTPTPSTRKLLIADIIVDAGTQMRAQPLLTTIADYADAMEDGAKFPPIIVYSDEASYWLADGFQRLEAAKTVGAVEIEAEVRPGTLRDAVLFACGANATHGERRTNDDKRKSVLTLLLDTEWSHWTDNHIAEVCGLSQTFVSKVRRELSTVLSDDDSTRTYVDKHGNISTMDTSSIGRRASEEPKSSTDVVTVTTSMNGHDETSTRPDVTIPVTAEPKTPPIEPPSQELPLVEDGHVAPDDPPSQELFSPAEPMPQTPPCSTCAQVRPLVDHALIALRRLTLEQREGDGVQDYQAALEAIRDLIPLPTWREAVPHA